jgi:hypothetical protein
MIAPRYAASVRKLLAGCPEPKVPGPSHEARIHAIASLEVAIARTARRRKAVRRGGAIMAVATAAACAAAVAGVFH